MCITLAAANRGEKKMKLKNLNLYSDNITIFTNVYDDVFLVNCTRSTFQELKNSHLEIDEITVLANNDVHVYSSVKNYNIRFIMKSFGMGLTVMNSNLKKITRDDFFNYLNE